MAIADRELKTGTVLKAERKGRTYTCIVRDPKEGPRLYVVQDFDSPLAPAGECQSLSRAAAAVKGAKSSAGINGWAFWTREADFAAGNGHRAPAKAAAKKAPGTAARKPTAKKAPAAVSETAPEPGA